MRRTLGLAATAALALGTLGVQGAVTSSATSAPATPVQALQVDRGAVADAAVAALLSHPGAAHAAAGQAFHARQTEVDRDGTSHVRVDRSLHGVPVLGGDLVVHRAADGRWEGVSQTLTRPLTLSTTPSLGAPAATAAALAPSAATRAISNLRAADAAPRLVVDARGATPRLAWEVLTLGRRADGTPSRLTSYVDAVDGSVIGREEGIETVDGSGQSLYSGTVPISITQKGSSYTLTDAAHGGSVTTDMGNKEDSALCTYVGYGCTNGTVYTSPDASFGNGATSNRETAAVDAVYGGAETFDFYKTTFGRAGIFGTGAGAPSRVHYGSGYVNAFWDGSKMTYGDGDGASYGPLVSLDVAGHEMSHGVTENTAGLTYSGESGGLNEATSDIFGTMVEFYAANANDPGDYYIGEQFDLKNHSGFRRMDNPALDGVSLSCYSSSAGNADVHYSSGIANHFFYLLSEGSGAKVIGGRQHNSPTCNGSTVAGIGNAKAAQIWFRALTTYFTSSTNYAGARTATLKAAGDLYGAGSAEQSAVAAAWSAVSVG